MERDGKVLWVATPWHAADATNQFMQRSGWCSLVESVSESCQDIEQQVVGAAASDPAYPSRARPSRVSRQRPYPIQGWIAPARTRVSRT
jgi:hypothetical protein